MDYRFTRLGCAIGSSALLAIAVSSFLDTDPAPSLRAHPGYEPLQAHASGGRDRDGSGHPGVPLDLESISRQTIGPDLCELTPPASIPTTTTPTRPLEFLPSTQQTATGPIITLTDAPDAFIPTTGTPAPSVTPTLRPCPTGIGLARTGTPSARGLYAIVIVSAAAGLTCLILKRFTPRRH